MMFIASPPKFVHSFINIYLFAGVQFTFLNPKFQVLMLTCLQHLPLLTAFSFLELSPPLASTAQSSTEDPGSSQFAFFLFDITSLQSFPFLLQHVKRHNTPTDLSLSIFSTPVTLSTHLGSVTSKCGSSRLHVPNDITFLCFNNVHRKRNICRVIFSPLLLL